MDEDDAIVGVRVDGRGFASDVAAMRATLEGSLGDAADTGCAMFRRISLRAGCAARDWVQSMTARSAMS